ncbi:MAG TPA: sigma-70 family RNA polymerase sigma factor [Myxococcota bacterium]|nr:sigma-70 family RNA polymerase sigma factor [Myxococcota bacterium]
MANHTTDPKADEADRDAIHRIASGDERALGRLYDRHAGSLMAIGMHMLRDQAAAEDAVHDVFMEAWKKAETFDASRGTVRGWLLLRMRSRCLDRVRAGAVRRGLTEHEAPTPAPSPRPDEARGSGDSDRVQAAMQLLPAAQRDVLDLIYFRGLSSQEAANTLECPVGTVKSRVRLAMTALRGVLAAEVSP